MSSAERSARLPSLLDGCFDADRSAAADPASDQRSRVAGHPTGCPRRAKRGGAPQGTSNIDERSDGDVYGATPSAAAKETIILPKDRWGDGRSRGSRSPSGEPPEAPWGVASKTAHLAGHVGEASA